MLQCVYQQLPLDRNEASNVIDQIPDVNQSSSYDDYEEGVNNLGVVSDINDEDYREGMTIEQSGVNLHSYRSNEDDSKMVVDPPRLHHYTNVRTRDAIDTLLCWLRASKVCKFHDDGIVKIIRSWLPVPNNLPSTLEGLLSSGNSGGLSDIPFGHTYQELLKKFSSQNLLSFILHLDDIGLCKSTKLKMWLLSTSIIELPPRLRYRRHNMLVVSIWIGHKGPNIRMWLGNSFRMLLNLKKQQVYVNPSTSFNIKYYGVIGDCPALKLTLNFIGHIGYYYCFFCFTQGYNIPGRNKR
ncbi:unnamed protein product [Didymodactylos carnosus]|uniref:Uncharacterized protein n=1 Tax=Didymodactylos carnosus TaxID=1234261 RepID=A0A8S2NSG4_9BILA|nr:unnamed protein product [Didymodactylos carnosus]CAF4015303.1 unnamed protein product [Didymodactylos carnosus]